MTLTGTVTITILSEKPHRPVDPESAAVFYLPMGIENIFYLT